MHRNRKKTVLQIITCAIYPRDARKNVDHSGVRGEAR